MKRLIIIFAALLPLIATAQQLKVAILEPVDKEQDINYGVKLLLRSSITTAISNTPGYEGYDRVDMASIAGEQEFQRTGNVSDNQIKQIGVATGAAYVLVTEAAKYDETSTTLIITAKILDVETFGVKSSAVQITGIDADEMQYSCACLAAQLLGTTPPPPPKHTKADKPKAETTSTTLTPKQAMEEAKRALRQAQQLLQSPPDTATEVVLLTTLTDGTSIYVSTADESSLYNHDNAAEACACKGEGWRVPTTDELKLMYDNKKAIGGFTIWIAYWGTEKGKMMDMGIGKMLPKVNIATGKVRCVKEVK
ncbi:MAG: hypothetical protein IKM79_00120 [Bacteroidales bacterium]|nr:hypothetical protein [Bacteroidales bacterium]